MERPCRSYDPPFLGARSADDYIAPHFEPGAAHGRFQKLLRVLVLCALFLGTWRVFRWGWTNLTASDICLLLAGAILLIQGRLNAKPFGELSSVWFLGFAAMIGGLLLGTVVNGEPARWIIASSQYFFAYVFLPMFFMSLERRLLVQGMILFVLGVALSQVIGIVLAQFLDYTDTYQTLDHGFITPNGRIGAMVGEPNLNGATCAFGLAMTAYLYLSRGVGAIFAIACGAAICAGLLISASFTGFVAAAAGLGIMIVAAGGRSTVKPAMALVLVATGYVYLGGPIPEVFNERVGGALLSGDMSQAGTFVERTYLIHEAWEMMEETALVGLGVDGYRLASSYGIPVHNLYLIIGNEGGLIALLGLFALLCVIMAHAISFYRRDRLDGAICLAVLAVFLAYSFAIPHMYTRMWTIPIFLCLALAHKSSRGAPGQGDRGQ